MNIGILTYHRSQNYGAFMQAYSLSKQIAERFPFANVEVIDYISKEVFVQYNPSLLGFVYLVFGGKRPLRRRAMYLKLFISYLRNKSARDKSASEKEQQFCMTLQNLPLSAETIVSDNYNKIVSYVNDRYDVVIIGSDAVWNWQIRSFPNPYLGGEELKPIKMSYAASSYGQPFQSLNVDKLSYLNQAWSTFSYIGVRDCPTEEFVKKVNPDLLPQHNCDPTVFLNLSVLPVKKEDVLEKLIALGYDTQKKTIGIMSHSWLARIVREQLGKDYQIVSLFNYNKDADINLLCVNPFEWAVAFSFFDVTITHYFHGNLLSLKNGTPTITVEQRNPYNVEYGSKIRDFMKRIGFDGYCYYVDEVADNNKLHYIAKGVLDDKDYQQRLSQAMAEEAHTFDSFANRLEEILTK